MLKSPHRFDSDQTRLADAMRRRSEESFDRTSIIVKQELVDAFSDPRAVFPQSLATSDRKHKYVDTPSLPLTRTNLAMLQEQFDNMKLKTFAAMPSPAASPDVDVQQEADVCTPPTAAESDAIVDESVPRNTHNSIFCCASNKIICVGPGVDEGDNRDVIECFVKDFAYHEERYLSREDTKDAFLACKLIVEVQRTVEEKTQTRYFIPSITYKNKYVEVHPRDIFYANPFGYRNNHVFMFLKCWDLKHKKKWVARRVTLLNKPHFLKGTEIYRECRGEWFASGPVANWGETWARDDE